MKVLCSPSLTPRPLIVDELEAVDGGEAGERFQQVEVGSSADSTGSNNSRETGGQQGRKTGDARYFAVNCVVLRCYFLTTASGRAPCLNGCG